MFQYESDAQRVYEAVIKKNGTFGLELSKEKTRILPFEDTVFQEKHLIF